MRERERERRTGMDTSGSVGRAGGITDIFLLRAENKKKKKKKKNRQGVYVCI